MRSQRPALSVLRMKPRRSAHQVYLRSAWRVSAMTAATAFSKPCCCWLEKGRLLGSAQTRKSRADAGVASSSVAAAIALRKTEHIEGASLGRHVLEVGHGTGEAQGGSRIARVEIAGYHRAGPAADPRQHRDMLVAVGAAPGRRLANDAGARLELPKHGAGLGIDGFEPAFHRAVEGDVAS